MWDTVADSFYRVFTNITREVDAQTDIKKLKMKGEQGLDNYIATFEWLARLGGYNMDDQAMVDMFIDGLPQQLAINVAKFNAPQNYRQWKEGAIQHHMTFMWIKSNSATRDKRPKAAPPKINGKRHFPKRGGTMLWTPHQDGLKHMPLTLSPLLWMNKENS